MTYVIFSIDNVTDTHTLAKFLRHFDTQVALSKTKGYLMPCIGSYNGKLEQSFICRTEDYLDYVESYAAIKVFEDYGFTAYEADDTDKDADESASQDTDSTEADKDSADSADSTSK